MTKVIPKFKVGDIVNSSLSSPQVVEEIRIGTEKDFTGKFIDHSGALCYVLRYLDGLRISTIHSCVAVDSDHHPKGSEMFEIYENARKAP